MSLKYSDIAPAVHSMSSSQAMEVANISRAAAASLADQDAGVQLSSCVVLTKPDGSPYTNLTQLRAAFPAAATSPKAIAMVGPSWSNVTLCYNNGAAWVPVASTSDFDGNDVTKPLKYYQTSSADFSAALRAYVTDLITYAASHGNRGFTVEIPPGTFTHDGTPINLPSAYAHMRRLGTVRLECDGTTTTANPVFWERADLSGYQPPAVGSVIAAGVGEIMGGNGMLLAYNMDRAGCLIRRGSADGEMGTLYAGAQPVYTINTVWKGIQTHGFGHTLQLTSGQVFCAHLEDFWANGHSSFLYTSAAAGWDFGECHDWNRVFISNSQGATMRIRAAHEFAIRRSSLTGNASTIFSFEAQDARVTCDGMTRLEKFNLISNSTGAFDRTQLNLECNTEIIPNKGSLLCHLHEFFHGNHKVVIGSAKIDMGNNPTYDSTYAPHANKFISDSATDITVDLLTVNQGAAPVFNTTPMWSRASITPNATLLTSAYNVALIGSGTMVYVGGGGPDGDGAVKLTVSNQQGFVYFPRGPVQAGQKVGVNPSIKVASSGPSPSVPFAVFCRLNFYSGPGNMGAVNNPIATSAGSTLITLQGTYLGMSCQPDDLVFIGGNPGVVDGIAALALVGWRRVVSCPAVDKITYNADTAAVAGTAGAGGSGISVQVPAVYISSSAYQLTQIPSGMYDTWWQHGGSMPQSAPAGTEYCRPEVATGTAMTGALSIGSIITNKYAG